MSSTTHSVNETVASSHENTAVELYGDFYENPRWIHVSELREEHGEESVDYLADVIELACDDQLLGRPQRSADELIEALA